MRRSRLRGVAKPACLSQRGQLAQRMLLDLAGALAGEPERAPHLVEGVRVLAEGVETRAEFDFLRSLGIDLYQGYLLARPGFRALPEVDWAAIGM